MDTYPHHEEHLKSSELITDIVIGMSDGLTVPFALAAGLSGAVESSGIIVTAGAGGGGPRGRGDGGGERHPGRQKAVGELHDALRAWPGGAGPEAGRPQRPDHRPLVRRRRPGA